MDNFILRELNSGRLINYIENNKPHYARNIGSAIKFPTDSEADNYIIENGLKLYNFNVESA